MARTPAGKTIGTVVAINRYPVKSMGGESLDAADLHWPSLYGDRQYAFVKAADTSDFPWLTGRDLPGLVRHRARYATPDNPRARVLVMEPDGAEHDIRDPALAARLADAAGTPVWLMRLGRGAFDAMPVSVIATTTAAAISAAHGAPVALDRFRANLVIQPDDPAATERDWLGGSLMFGEEDDTPSVSAGWPIPRCAMVGIDPVTAARDAGVVRTVVRQFGNRVGVYCSVRTPGTVRVGDRVRAVA